MSKKHRIFFSISFVFVMGGVLLIPRENRKTVGSNISTHSKIGGGSTLEPPSREVSITKKNLSPNMLRGRSIFELTEQFKNKKHNIFFDFEDFSKRLEPSHFSEMNEYVKDIGSIGKIGNFHGILASTPEVILHRMAMMDIFLRLLDSKSSQLATEAQKSLAIWINIPIGNSVQSKKVIIAEKLEILARLMKRHRLVANQLMNQMKGDLEKKKLSILLSQKVSLPLFEIE